MTRIAVRRIMKILVIVTIVILLLVGGAMASVEATEGLQSASILPSMRQHLTAALRLISILVSRHGESEGNVVVIGLYSPFFSASSPRFCVSFY